MARAKVKESSRRFDWEHFLQPVLRMATREDLNALAEMVEVAKAQLEANEGIPEPMIV